MFQGVDRVDPDTESSGLDRLADQKRGSWSRGVLFCVVPRQEEIESSRGSRSKPC